MKIYYFAGAQEITRNNYPKKNLFFLLARTEITKIAHKPKRHNRNRTDETTRDRPEQQKPKKMIPNWPPTQQDQPRQHRPTKSQPKSQGHDVSNVPFLDTAFLRTSCPTGCCWRTFVGGTGKIRITAKTTRAINNNNNKNKTCS
ncbi:hypothetical protein BDC45DRAFT_503971 [Circinella umbellata]|nr:hypothetical protein BDC45DRAFT_503971 [Circinella umbellata]